jgi:hypothetical protein
MFDYPENYGPFVSFTRGEKTIIYTKDITSDNVDYYFNSLLNVLRDGINSDQVMSNFITYVFDDGTDVDLSIPDSYTNIALWKLVVMTGNHIEPKHLVFEDDFVADMIADFINNYLIIPYRKDMDNIRLNNIIDDIEYQFKSIDEFSMFLANTANLKDYRDLMNENPRAYDIMHCDLSGYPINEVNNIANQLNDELVDIIKNSEDHCYKDSFKAREAINKKQHREFAVAGGAKPNGVGGIFSKIINSNYIVGGLSNATEHTIEEYSGRTAQLLSKTNVSDSGHLARLLGLNNQDTELNEDPNYDCGTRNFVKITITSYEMLKKYISRYYRFYPDGQEFMITGMEMDLIGKTVYFRSPAKCKSFSEGNGICYKCYGDVAYTNRDINIGKIAAELLSSELTQKLLSAKHLLEAKIKELKWVKQFGDFFILDGNLISIRDDIEIKDTLLIIDSEIHIENEYENYEYNQSVCEIKVRDEEGNLFSLSTEDDDDIYFTPELSAMIDKYTDVDGIVTIPFDEINEMNIFMMQIRNNGLADTLKRLTNLINKSEVTSKHTIDSLIQTFVETCIEGDVKTDAIHCEVIIANQIRLGLESDEILEKPDWSIPNNNRYTILTLSKALNNHPSVAISLSYERTKRAIYTAATFKKRSPSFMDLFFMVNYYDFINAPGDYSTEVKYNNDMVVPATIVKRDEE